MYLPGFFISKTYKKWALGFGNYIPYGGGGTTFDHFQKSGSPYQYSMGLIAFTQAVAYRLRDDLSIGAGFTTYYGMLTSDIVGTRSTYGGIAGFGSNVGLMYKPEGKWSMGLSARSPVKVNMDGESDNGTNVNGSEVSFTLPTYLECGFGYELHEKITLGLSTRYIFWNDLEEFSFNTAGAEFESATNYRNSWMVGLGMEYRMTDRLSLWGGLKYDQGATHKFALDAASVDIDRLTYSLGAAYKITQLFELAVTGIYAWGFTQGYEAQTFEQVDYMLLCGVRFKKPGSVEK